MTLEERFRNYKQEADAYADSYIHRNSTPEFISDALKEFKGYEDPFTLQEDMKILQKYVNLRFGQ